MTNCYNINFTFTFPISIEVKFVSLRIMRLDYLSGPQKNNDNTQIHWSLPLLNNKKKICQQPFLRIRECKHNHCFCYRQFYDPNK